MGRKAGIVVAGSSADLCKLIVISAQGVIQNCTSTMLRNYIHWGYKHRALS